MMKYKIKMIGTYDIVPNTNQIRHYQDDEKLNTLVESIRHCGVLQPLLVRKRKPSGIVLINDEKIFWQKYEIIAGERRWRCAKLLNIRKLPCIIIEADNEGSILIALNENLQRQHLNFFEQAIQFRQILQKYNLSIEDLSELISIPTNVIKSKICLLALSDEEKDVICNYKLTEDHARELIRIKDPEYRKKLLTKIAASGLNIYDTEELIDEYLDPLHPENMIKEEEKRTSIFKISDIRFFYNSLERALSILKHTGINVVEEKVEKDNIIDIHIKIQKS